MARALPSRVLTVYHYEAQFVDPNIGVNLEQAIRNSVTRLSTVGAREEQGKDILCKQTLNDMSDFGAAGFGISIIEYEPGGFAQVVPDFSLSASVSCDAFELPDGRTLVSRDCMVFISGNRIAVCGCNNGKDMFRSYLTRLMKRANILNAAADIIITAVADSDVHARIMQKGIKSIAVTAQSGLAEINHALRNQGRAQSSLVRFFSAFATESDPVSGDAKLWLKLNKGNKPNPKLDEQMKLYALELMNEEHTDLDDFLIYIRGESKPIRGSQLNKTTQIDVAKLGHSVQAAEAWQKLYGVLN